MEKWKKTVANNGAFGAISTNLLKLFFCLRPERLIIKSDAHGFGMNFVLPFYYHPKIEKEK